MKSTISAKGQITVPRQIRQKLGLAPGSVVEFKIVNGGALLRKGISGQHPVDRVYGVLRLGRSVDETMDDMRGPRPREKR